MPCKGVAPDAMNQCEAANVSQEAILFTGLYLVALGTGGVKSALPAMGADQFDEKDPNEAVHLSSFFNWFLFSLNAGALVGVTFLVWISTNQGWEWSFAVCTMAVLFAILFLCLGKPCIESMCRKEAPSFALHRLKLIACKQMHCKISKFQVSGQGCNSRKITGIPNGIRYLQRIGVGLVLSAISMAVSGIVETHRKSVAIEHKMVDSVEPLPMSVFWLGFQYAIFGAADMFTMVGLLDFFYAESSAGMKSLSTAIPWCSLAFGYFMSSVVVEIVNKASGGWLASNNLNRDKLNYFYWLLAVLSVVNFVFYLVCASWYKYKKVEVKKVESYGEDEAKVELVGV
ncbi:hypothetical protein GH714_005535 [Hevea brasiliensis]|uniref:Major facilitator superfamily (MFS) profile domain-containing protein n=1 Tax=Hevea brasiliensis TaxID=3981 RepID=A0A6A6MCF1_HEVBR|nr:hypothetical protein GH714_005535 [Hevea brasiliensis]